MVRDERYYTGIIRDIGERKRAEKALRQSEQELREKSE
jgi:PAS domain-containing protein